MWADYRRAEQKTRSPARLSGLKHPPRLGSISAGALLTHFFVLVVVSASFLFSYQSVGDAELRDAAPPQKALHPAETSGGPAAGRGGLPLQDHIRGLPNLRVSVTGPGSSFTRTLNELPARRKTTVTEPNRRRTDRLKRQDPVRCRKVSD